MGISVTGTQGTDQTEEETTMTPNWASFCLVFGMADSLPSNPFVQSNIGHAEGPVGPSTSLVVALPFTSPVTEGNALALFATITLDNGNTDGITTSLTDSFGNTADPWSGPLYANVGFTGSPQAGPFSVQGCMFPLPGGADTLTFTVTAADNCSARVDFVIAEYTGVVPIVDGWGGLAGVGSSSWSSDPLQNVQVGSLLSAGTNPIHYLAVLNITSSVIVAKGWADPTGFTERTETPGGIGHVLLDQVLNIATPGLNGSGDGSLFPTPITITYTDPSIVTPPTPPVPPIPPTPPTPPTPPISNAPSVVVAGSSIQRVNSSTYADSLGILVGIDRLPGEDSATYLDRLSLAVISSRSAGYTGLMNQICLELGLSMFQAIQISGPAGASIQSSLAGLVLIAGSVQTPIPLVTLTADDFWQWQTFSGLVASINQVVGFTATLSGPDGFALQLAHQSNINQVRAEDISGQTVILRYGSLVQGSESFSTGVPAYSYGIDGRTLRFVSPVPEGCQATYQYGLLPYNLVASPVGLFSLTDPGLARISLGVNGKMVYQLREYLWNIMQRDLSYWGS